MDASQMQTAARQDPQAVFLIELLATGLGSIPGIGTLMTGDVTFGLMALLGYPFVVITLWTIIITVTCGFGAILVFLQLPINFAVGYWLGTRAKQRVIDARRALGVPLPPGVT